MKKWMISLAAVVSMVSAAAHADVGVAVKTGITGLGVEVSQYYNESVSTRVSVGSLKINKTFDEDDVTYDGKLKMGGLAALADYHPFQGRFHVTAGIVKLDTGLSGSAKYNGGTVKINGNTYNGSDVGSLDASIKWNKVGPYVGFGFDGGNADKDGGFYTRTDIGVIYAGKAKVSVNANCTNPAVCTSLQSDIDAQRQKLEDSANDMKILPVMQFSLGYKF